MDLEILLFKIIRNMLKNIILLIAIFSYTATANIAERLVEKSLNARGGEEAIKKLENWDILASSVNPSSGQSDDFILKFKGENAFYVEQNVNGNQNLFLSDGTNAWYKAPMLQVMELTPLEEPILSQFKQSFKQQINLIKGVLIGLKDKGLEVSFQGKEEYNGENVNKIKIINPAIPDSLNNQDYFVFISDKDNLVKKINISTTQGSFDIILSDYKKVSNFKFPHSIEQFQNGVSTAKMLVKKLDINPQFDEKTFIKPEKKVDKK